MVTFLIPVDPAAVGEVIVVVEGRATVPVSVGEVRLLLVSVWLPVVVTTGTPPA